MGLNRKQLSKISAYVKGASARTKELTSLVASNRSRMSVAQLDKVRKSVSTEYENISKIYNSLKRNIALGDIRRIASDEELDEVMDTLAVTGTSLDLLDTVLNDDAGEGFDDALVSQVAEDDVTVDDVLDSLGEPEGDVETEDDVEPEDVPGSKSNAVRKGRAFSKSRAYNSAFGRGSKASRSAGSSTGFINFRKR